MAGLVVRGGVSMEGNFPSQLTVHRSSCEPLPWLLPLLLEALPLLPAAARSRWLFCTYSRRLKGAAKWMRACP